jgi:hypothetical protein
LPRGALLVNVARGTIVVDEDLIALLDEGHLAGATLDVFREEPLPPGHPFWHHPRITLTPHTSAVTLVEDSIAQVSQDPAAGARRAGDRCGRSRPRILISHCQPHDTKHQASVGGSPGRGRAARRLQNEKAMVPTDEKVALIDALTEAGFPAIEATAFVSPKWVPQMADAVDVMKRIRRKPGVRYPVLTPNLKGFEAALAAQADEVAVFVAASENVLAQETSIRIDEQSHGQSVFALRPLPHSDAASVRATSRACSGAYEGEIEPLKVAPMREALHRMGAYEVSLGTRSGVVTAGKTAALFELVAEAGYGGCAGRSLPRHRSASRASPTSTRQWKPALRDVRLLRRGGSGG